MGSFDIRKVVTNWFARAQQWIASWGRRLRRASSMAVGFGVVLLLMTGWGHSQLPIGAGHIYELSWRSPIPISQQVNAQPLEQEVDNPNNEEEPLVEAPLDELDPLVDAPELPEVDPEQAVEDLRSFWSQTLHVLQRSLTKILTTVIATGFLLLIIWVTRKILSTLARFVDRWGKKNLGSVKIQRLELVSERQISNASVKVIQGVEKLLIFIYIILYGVFILKVFPATQSLSIILTGWVLSLGSIIWRGFVGYLPNLSFILIILLLVKYFLDFMKLIFTNLEQGTITFPGFYREWSRPTFQILRFIILLLALALVFPLLPGSSSPAFQGISIVVGLLVSLGSTAAVTNIVAGLALTYTRAFRVGDRVKIDNVSGDIIEKSVLVTRIRTIKNEEITIPNATVLSSQITNFSTSATDDGLILYVNISIGYDVPWEQVHDLMLSAAANTNHVLGDPKPFVLQTKLDDFYVNYELNVYTNEPRLISRIYSDLHQHLQTQFRDADVEILSPHYRFLRGDIAPEGGSSLGG